MALNINKTIKMISPNLACILHLLKHKYIINNKTKEARTIEEKKYREYLERFYIAGTGHILNLDNPERFTEKIQWRKLYDRNDIYSLLSDKYRVREWVDNKIGGEYLVPLYGHWGCFDEIDFDTLPDQFVLKANNGCHANIIVNDKKLFLRCLWSNGKLMEYWLQSPSYFEGLELHYGRIKPCIIAEKYLMPNIGEDCLSDYKFHCFNGKPFVCQVIRGRTSNETDDFYDMDWNLLPLRDPDYPNNEKTIDKPYYYDLMIQLAEKLSHGFQYVRVDMYCTDKVYFGEMTFTPANGTERYIPDKWDYEMGKQWNIHIPQVDYSEVFRNITYREIAEQ